MKIKTSELTGPALRWAVAQCEGRTDPYWMNDGICGAYKPDHYWLQGGPIIEREGIELHKWATDGWRAQATSYTFLNTPDEKPDFAEQYGPTPLIAAMRCFVASKLGDEVEVPDELA